VNKANEHHCTPVYSRPAKRVQRVHNFCGLACILGLTSSNNQIPLTTKERSVQARDSLETCCCFCYAVTQVALQLHQKRTQVVCSNREAQKRLAESSSTPFVSLFSPAMDLGHTNEVVYLTNVVLKLCICMFVAVATVD